MSSINTNFDQDFDSFFSLDEHTPLSSSSDSKPFGSFASSSQQTFSGPSYQYDSHRQQTGLPMGGLANTFAVNQATGLHYRPGNNGFVMPTETLNMPMSNLDEFDFARSQFEMNDMDLEGESPSDVPSMYGAGSSHQQPPPPQRIYPGMHTQQAAQAKAQKQQEMLRQLQQPQLVSGQRPLPTQAPKTPVAKDPHVEESISRLLNRMRQNSTASSEEGSTPVAGMTNMPRFKKEEDEMDEDERLLNSEEGKKLSSKERRQLRNKVSARAFRSRRKEYITQLESEVAGKVQEANDLRLQNRQLMEENTRLTDLTRMLLSSQAFSGFLQELSMNGGSMNMNGNQQVPSQPQQQQTPTVPKDVATHDAVRKLSTQNQQMQVGMTLIPETSFDVLDNSSAWNALPSNDFQVYAVTELPEPPKLDVAALCGKKNTSISSKEAPSLPAIPSVSKPALIPASEKIDETVELNENDFALFYDIPTTSTTIVALSLPTSLSLQLSKTGLASELTDKLVEQNNEMDAWESLRQLCATVDDSCDHLADFMPTGI